MPVSNYTKEVKKSKQEQAQVQAETVEVGESYEVYGVDIDKCIQKIQSKCRDKKHIAWVDQKDSKRRANGWKWLKISDGGEDVQEVETIEQADTTTSNVLCWRDRKHQDAIDRSIDKANIQSVLRERMEHTSNGQATKFNNLIGGTKGIKAKPLSDESED